ncbi:MULTISPECIES: 4Fe-4S dicluster domain-containing protein [unclassified Adlercreutzia]|uniref:4Fe-4S dicluster domain-containing protein n=1 Tax=unclassified Adlercreutzia TaxID=2636013 RepID=UPI0013ED3DD3|nr:MULTISPECIES: 4Fe-4S dicluster domain-containing protein [unclassified Adlercreutzia]
MKLGGVAAICAAGIVSVTAAFSAVNAEAKALHPPGALPEGGFNSLCIKCGKCIEACPYKAIHAASFEYGSSVGQPVINAREQACRLCEDFPCIEACPTGALSPVGGRQDVRMGRAVIDEQTCLSFKGMRCEVCYRACPLIDVAISIDYGAREGDDIHALFRPVIQDACVGCGLCVERCVVSDPAPAITIDPN